jgi:hypothetical protein
MLHRLVPILAAAAIIAGCAAGGATSSPPSVGPSAVIATVAPTASVAILAPTASPSATPIATPQQPFRSAIYGYALTSMDWTGTPTTVAWDGTGSPGDGDPFVDAMIGPKGRGWAAAVQTKATLDSFAKASRTTNATVHPCPAKPESTQKRTIGGVPALVDAMHCPVGGVFALNAYVVRDGRAYVFFTYDQPENEPVVREGFRSLLDAVSFAP